MNKEVSDALHFLLHCSLKDKRFTTQKEQFNIVYEEIERLHSIIKEVREYIEENMSYIEKGKLEYIPSGEELLEILDKVEEK